MKRSLQPLLWPIALAVGLALAAGPAHAQTAAELNAEGMRLYKQKKVAEAADKFKSATEKDGRHALAHYNLACTSAVLRAQKSDDCQLTSISSILTALRTAVTLKPALAKTAQKDADLKSVRGTFYFQTAIMGLSPTKAEDIPTLLQKVTWSSVVGESGTQSYWRNLAFAAGGKVVFTYEQPTDSGEMKKVKVRGTWKVVGGAVELELQRAAGGSKKHTGKFTAKGLEFPKAFGGSYDDDFPECSA